MPLLAHPWDVMISLMGRLHFSGLFVLHHLLIAGLASDWSEDAAGRSPPGVRQLVTQRGDLHQLPARSAADLYFQDPLMAGRYRHAYPGVLRGWLAIPPPNCARPRLAVLLGGNMAVGVYGDDLLVRTDPGQQDMLLAEPGTRPFDMTGRPMKGWIVVDASMCAEDDDLGRWVSRSVAHGRSLPPK